MNNVDVCLGRQSEDAFNDLEAFLLKGMSKCGTAQWLLFRMKNVHCEMH